MANKTIIENKLFETCVMPNPNDEAWKWIIMYQIMAEKYANMLSTTASERGHSVDQIKMRLHKDVKEECARKTDQKHAMIFWSID